MKQESTIRRILGLSFGSLNFRQQGNGLEGAARVWLPSYGPVNSRDKRACIPGARCLLVDTSPDEVLHIFVLVIHLGPYITLTEGL